MDVDDLQAHGVSWEGEDNRLVKIVGNCSNDTDQALFEV